MRTETMLFANDVVVATAASARARELGLNDDPAH